LGDEVEFSSFYDTKYFMVDSDKAYYNRLIAEELKKCRYLDNCQNFQYVVNDSITISIGSNGKGYITSTNETEIFNSAFAGHHLVIKTKTGREYGTFNIDTVTSNTRIEVTRLSDGHYAGSTWTGGFYITFNKITNLSDLNGEKVMVVADGGYLGEFTVTDGTLEFDREISSCVVGIGYQGILKTFNVGDYMNGKNYQTAPKRIAKVIMRFVYSAGVEVGTALDTLKEIQYFAPTGFYDLPPLPMDGDERRAIPDTIADWKELFVVQNMPLPVNLTMIQYNTEFGG
jgi:hypothetical protein